MQDRASSIIEELVYFHDFSIAIILIIIILVGMGISFICYYNLSDKFLIQNQLIEVMWTVIPVFILLLIALPSLKILYLLDDPFCPRITIKTIGHQWYWSYEYSDFPGIDFSSYIVVEEKKLLGEFRLLETDNSVILPVNTQLRMVTTAMDVIHAWTVPSLGIKVDAIPGRLNQILFRVNRPGIFFGQCSEICGANHSFIPIKIEAVPINIFLIWIRKF